MLRVVEGIGRGTLKGVDQIGYAAALLAESLTLIVLGRRQHQPVRVPAVVAEMAHIGVHALPIATLLSIAIGGMLAIQSLYSLGLFGAESYAYIGIALAVTREFSPLIIGILIAGRSGSALAARLSTMSINQEVDALQVMGINPVRFLVAPAFIALVVMVPALTVWSDVVSLAAAGFVVTGSLDTSFAAYAMDIADLLSPNDILHGLTKSVLFGALIALISALNGSQVSGGAEGVGRVTTRSVVQSISAIIIADLIFAFAVTL
jgi:phospholipid/cholesterol/gamma-HCH transport system permease protein